MIDIYDCFSIYGSLSAASRMKVKLTMSTTETLKSERVFRQKFWKNVMELMLAFNCYQMVQDLAPFPLVKMIPLFSL